MASLSRPGAALTAITMPGAAAGDFLVVRGGPCVGTTAAVMTSDTDGFLSVMAHLRDCKHQQAMYAPCAAQVLLAGCAACYGQVVMFD